MLSHPKPLDKILPNLVCELLTYMGRATAHLFGPAPWGPWEGPKGQISLNIIKFQLQSQFQRFFNQIVSVFSHMKDIKHIGRGFSFAHLGHAPGVELGGAVGGGRGVNFFPIFNQFWCVSYLHEWHMHRCHFWPPLGPW